MYGELSDNHREEFIMRRNLFFAFSDILIVLIGTLLILSSCTASGGGGRSTPSPDCGYGCHTGHRE